MFKRVDEISVLQGFSYNNERGREEFVKFGRYGGVIVADSSGNEIAIYLSDIPKLIKALTAAQEHLGERV